jgi:hypothetical protein
MSEPRYNQEAEEGVIGIALIDARAIPRMVADLDGADFYSPRCAAAFSAVVELHQSGHAVDTLTIGDVFHRTGGLQDPAMLTEFMNAVPSVHALSTYISIIRREAVARSAQMALSEARVGLDDQGDPVEVIDVLTERLKTLDRVGKLPDRYWPSAKDYLATDHSETLTPLAEGVCYPLSRIMVIATEKLGKSVLLRQMAFCLAAGVHPFDPSIQIDPVRVLLLDAENDDDELVPTMEKVRACVEYYAGPEASWPATYSVPYGVDLETRRDRNDLLTVLEDARPQVIIGGPVYKLTDQVKDMSEDRRAAIVQSVFNDVRKRFGSAVILEHHAPTGSGKQARDMKAKGGQVWPAWVNMTIALHSEREGQSARVGYPHPPRGYFRWPKRFDRGVHMGEWPWVPVRRAASDPTLPLETDDGPPPDGPPDFREEPF